MGSGTDTGGLKVISSDRAAELMKSGWHKADLHVHTCCSFDVLSVASMHPESLFRKGRKNGLDMITFTDHDTVKGNDIIGWKREGFVPGVELSVSDPVNVGHTVHINVFGFDREQFLEFDLLARERRDIYSLIDYFRSNDLPYIYNHPFWFPRGDRPNLLAVPELVRHFPVIEYNMHDLRQKNLFAMALAERCEKGMVATSDSHTGNIGSVYTIAKGDTFHEFFSNISKGRSCMVIDEPFWKHLTGELNSWIELAFSRRKVIGEEIDFTTGMEELDKLVSILGSDSLEKSPRMRYTAKSILKYISGSGLPALMYMVSKQPQVSRIGRMITHEASL